MSLARNTIVSLDDTTNYPPELPPRTITTSRAALTYVALIITIAIRNTVTSTARFKAYVDLKPAQISIPCSPKVED